MTGCRIRPCASATTASGMRAVVGAVARRISAAEPGGPCAAAPPRPRPPADPAEALARHLARIGRLTKDELDRLALAESPPIAFVATIARFLSPDRLAEVEAVERRVAAALPAASRWDAPTRDAIVAYAHEIILGPFLDEHLSEPFRERVRERLARGWEAAVDQPRYGPNTAAVVRGPRAPPVDAARPTGPARRRARRGQRTLVAGRPSRRSAVAGGPVRPGRRRAAGLVGARPGRCRGDRRRSGACDRPTLAGPGDARPRPPPRLQAGRAGPPPRAVARGRCSSAPSTVRPKARDGRVEPRI